jgi:hypothetical protein
MKNGQQIIDTITDILSRSDILCTDHNILKYVRRLSYQQNSELVKEKSNHSPDYLIYLDEMAK